MSLFKKEAYRLNEKLHNSDETGELILFGGAVMCLVFGSRGYTRDIDAVFEPKGSIYSYAQSRKQIWLCS
jgi:hypothetical protein